MDRFILFRVEDEDGSHNYRGGEILSDSSISHQDLASAKTTSTRSRIVLDYTTISATDLLVRVLCSSLCQLNQSKAQGSDLVHDLQHLHSAIWYLADAMIMRLKLFNCTYACARAVMPVLRQPLACESSSRLTGLLTDPLCPSSACRFL